MVEVLSSIERGLEGLDYAKAGSLSSTLGAAGVIYTAGCRRLLHLQVQKGADED